MSAATPPRRFSPGAEPQPFGALGGEPIEQARLVAPNGAELDVLEFGAVVRSLRVPVGGGLREVVLGFERLEDYVAHSPHFGAIAGRFANRIAGGRFSLDGVEHFLSVNEGRNSLHGGGQGFGKRAWRLVGGDGAGERPASATLALHSPAGDAGYPGALDVTCRYALLGDGAGTTLRVDLVAVADAATIVNLCHHSYFNLSGADTVLDHRMQIDADLMTAVDDALIPTGAIVPVADGPYDFRTSRPIRHPELGRGLFYDHNFVLRRASEIVDADGHRLARAARVEVDDLRLEVWTTEPGVQLYAGGKLDVPVPGPGGRRYGPNGGLCLEPQRFPDTPNHAHFPSATLRPGEAYRQRTEYRFAAV